MSIDVFTVAWKEWKELFARQGRFRGGTVNFVLVLCVFGVVMPLQFGRGWVDSPAMLLSWTWVPLLLLSHVVVDAVAGERERHTLETLLASRLPDHAIPFGKIVAAVGYGLMVTAGSLALGLVTANVMFERGGIVLYPPATIAGALILTLLGAALAASLGVLVSLRAPTVRQAGQLMGVAVLLVSLGPVLVFRTASTWLGTHEFARPVSLAAAGMIAFAAFVILDAVLIATVMSRFQRTRLTLD
jgi:ABC-2 type transport system permease protein